MSTLSPVGRQGQEAEGVLLIPPPRTDVDPLWDCGEVASLLPPRWDEENSAGLRGLPPGLGACREPWEPDPAPAPSQSPSCHSSQYIIIIMCK